MTSSRLKNRVQRTENQRVGASLVGALFRGFCSRFVEKSALSTHLFALKNVVMSNYSLEKVCLSLNYSLEKVYFCTQTKMQYDAEKKN